MTKLYYKVHRFAQLVYLLLFFSTVFFQSKINVVDLYCSKHANIVTISSYNSFMSLGPT